MTPDAKTRIFAIKRGILEDRIDVHFYAPQYLSLIRRLVAQDSLRLGDLVEFSNEVVDFSQWNGDSFDYLEISGVKLLHDEYKTSKVLISEAPSRAKMKTHPGDIVVSLTRPQRGAIACIREKNIIASTGFAVVRDICMEYERDWLVYVLASSPSLLQMEQRSSGGNYPAITEDQLKKVLIPKFSIETQRRQISYLQAKHQAYHDKLRQADDLLAGMDDFVLNILQISDKKRGNKLGFAVLLKDLNGAVNVKRHLNATRLESRLKVQDIADIVKQKINPQNCPEDVFDWIRIDDLPNQPIDIAETRTEQGDAIEGTFFEVRPGDILVARLGPTILNRKTVMVRAVRRRTIASAEFLVLRCKDGYLPEAVMAILKTHFYVDQMYAHARGSTPSRYRLNREDMLNLTFPDIADKQLQQLIAREALSRRCKAVELRETAEKDWKDAREQFEKELLGE